MQIKCRQIRNTQTGSLTDTRKATPVLRFYVLGSLKNNNQRIYKLINYLKVR
jgi:hypothetical protein